MLYGYAVATGAWSVVRLLELRATSTSVSISLLGWGEHQEGPAGAALLDYKMRKHSVVKGFVKTSKLRRTALTVQNTVNLQTSAMKRTFDKQLLSELFAKIRYHFSSTSSTEYDLL